MITLPTCLIPLVLYHILFYNKILIYLDITISLWDLFYHLKLLNKPRRHVSKHEKEIIMRFPNWVCSDCGRQFGRKWNGERHIQLCHHGLGAMVSFIDYLSGRQFGIYHLGPPPSYRRKSTSFCDIYADEFNRSLAREAVNRFFD